VGVGHRGRDGMVDLGGQCRRFLVEFSYLYCGSVDNVQFSQIMNSGWCTVVCRTFTHHPETKGFKKHISCVW